VLAYDLRTAGSEQATARQLGVDRLAGRPSPAAEFPLIARRGDRRPTRAAKGVYCVSADVSARGGRTLANMSVIDPHGAGELKRFWCERAFADGNGDAGFG
jgi:hypothetical protein